jgi:hypothetical protein
MSNCDALASVTQSPEQSEGIGVSRSDIKTEPDVARLGVEWLPVPRRARQVIPLN